MLLPLKDDNPTTGPSWINWLLIGACVVVFIIQTGAPGLQGERIVYFWGVLPGRVTGAVPGELPGAPPAFLTLVSYQFLHGSWMHLLSNMLFLWIFGNNVEEAMGHLRYLAFYLLCGIGAAAVHLAIDPGSVTPMVGASGSIAGVLGAYAVLFPHARLLVLLWFIIIYPIRIAAGIFLAGYFVLQIVLGSLDDDGIGGVAFWAHVGGFLAGLLLVGPFRKTGVRLFAPPQTEGRVREPTQEGRRDQWRPGPPQPPPAPAGRSTPVPKVPPKGDGPPPGKKGPWG